MSDEKRSNESTAADSGFDPPPVRSYTLAICDQCINGAGGECHTPGCAFWVCPAPSAEQAEHIRAAAVIANPSAVGNPDEDPVVWVGPSVRRLLNPCACGGVNGFHAAGCSVVAAVSGTTPTDKDDHE